MLSVVLLLWGVLLCYYTKCFNAIMLRVVMHYAECCNALMLNVLWSYAECHYAFILSVIMPLWWVLICHYCEFWNSIMMSLDMKIFSVLCYYTEFCYAIMFSVVMSLSWAFLCKMLNVVLPLCCVFYAIIKCFMS
jgi:hypothetical protein